jgi:hypothetical protein
MNMDLEENVQKYNNTTMDVLNDILGRTCGRR